MTEIIFQEHPDVTLGTCVFRNVPTILQFEDTPMLEVGKFEGAGYRTRFPVFHSDGTQIAVVKGSQIYITDEGRKASIKTRFEPNLTVCELEGKPILELRRKGATALHGWAELYAPGGVLIRASSSEVSGLLRDGGQLNVGGFTLQGCTFDGCAVGIHVMHDKIRIGAGGTVKAQYIGPAGSQPPVLSP